MDKRNTDRLNQIVNKYSASPDLDEEVIPYSLRPLRKPANNNSAYIEIVKEQILCANCDRVLETQIYRTCNIPLCEACHEYAEIISKDKIQVSIGDRWTVLTRTKSGSITRTII